MKLHHIGFASNDISKTLAGLQGLLELKDVSAPFMDRIQEVNEIFLKIGDTAIELLEPTASSSPLFKFLEKRGNGLHHLAFEVDDLDAKMKELHDKNIKIACEPFVGYDSRRSAFVHPHSTDGLLVEFIEKEK